MKPVIFDQQRRFVRVLLLLAGGFALAGIASVVIAVAIAPEAKEGAEILLVLCGVFSVTMLICAAFTIPAARRASRMIERMQRGEALAHWVYPPEFWKAWVMRERRWFGLATWGAIAFLLFMGGVIVYALLTTSPEVNPTHRRDAAIAGCAAVVVIALILAGVRAYRRRRTDRLLRCGECYLLRDAVYVGGDFAFWNAQMRGLYSATLVDADEHGPAVIELTIGMSRRAARATRAAGAVSLAAGAAYVGDYQSVTRIPVPPEMIADAERAVRQWTKAN
jgi:hypothetical protein